jgi:hypothetical protein
VLSAECKEGRRRSPLFTQHSALSTSIIVLVLAVAVLVFVLVFRPEGGSLVVFGHPLA